MDATGVTPQRPEQPVVHTQPGSPNSASQPSLPSGTVAFLFTDIEGSTRRWQQEPRAMAAAVARHDVLLHAAIAEQGGTVFKTVGDAFCAAFATVPPAVAAALAAQRALAAEEWGKIGEIRVRMGIHVGDAEERDSDYFGPAVNRVARLMSAGHGGQILLSLPAAELARDTLPAAVRLRDLGEHRLKDLSRPEHIFQLVATNLPADFPALATLDHHPNNLPPQLTPLVGREQEMTNVCNLIARDDVRLVTLTGPGGTGKTRLGLQVGTELVDTYSDGVWFVPLEKATDETVVVTALAQALGVREVAGQPLADGVMEYLRGKRLLLLLDNFEQVVHVAPLFARLLREAPHIELLVTSRIRLGLQGEHEYAVPPLEVPDHTAAPAELMGCSAVRLFVERAQAAKSDFALTADNAAAVVEISRRLDGLPLAIELAAARVKLLPPRAMLSRLEHRLALLTGGGRDRPERQQTLRGAVAWSYDLLAPDERILFARLAVCAGGCTFEATEMIGNTDGEVDVLSDLEALVDHSLVRQTEDADGEPRFSMLATIREYAMERLTASDEADTIRERHADWCLQLTETAEPALLGRDQQAWLERLDREHDNVRAALAWSVEQGRAETAVRLAGAVARFWEMRGHFTEGRQYLEAVLALGGDVVAASRAKALRGLAALMVAQRAYEPAIVLYEESVALNRALDDRRGTADSLAGLASTALHQRHYERATRLYEEALELFEALENNWGIAVAKNGLATAALDQGDIPQAEALYTESLSLFKSLGNQRDAAKALNNLAIAAHERSDYPRAMALYDQSLEITRVLEDKRNLAMTLYNQGNAARDQGEFQRAADYFEESLALFRDLGNRGSVAYLLLDLGTVADALGDHARALALHEESLATFKEFSDRRGAGEVLGSMAATVQKQGDVLRAEGLYREALDIWRASDDNEGVADSLDGLAATASARGWPARAIRLATAAATIREAIDKPLSPLRQTEHDRTLDQARAALSDEAAATAQAAGEAYSLQAAIAEAFTTEIPAEEADAAHHGIDADAFNARMGRSA